MCVVGSGGREHALADVLSRAGDEVVVSPGNAGIPNSVPTDPGDIDADLFVIGPEVPLVAGLADRLRAQGKATFGPGADGARLEGSKRWMKQVLDEAGVPTARHRSFTDADEARSFLRTLSPPWVVKTDGLAAGKGVLVTTDRAEAEADVEAKLSGRAFGDAGRRIVIEEGLSGPELSVLAVCDGTTAVALAGAQDFKRLGDGDSGPNTGGMGAYSPVPVAPDALVDEVLETAVLPTLAALRRRGIDYRGVLYAGLMLTGDGPRVLEFNVRFGDPEAQVVLPRLDSDLATLLAEAAEGRLRSTPVFADDAAVTVVAAAEGYPAAPRPGDRIDGIDAARTVDGVRVYCAGVAAGPDGALVTAGGRVLDVTAMGPTLARARDRAYQGLCCLSWPGMHHRRDIAAAAAGLAPGAGAGKLTGGATMAGTPTTEGDRQ
ncbi:MAG TPA: phosphoribosylamine--glycine ligase [Acidimicrobiales bacterium]|nr:phosphoribosylamine--glycine ligase [Acidimicrobiales bacterium]